MMGSVVLRRLPFLDVLFAAFLLLFASAVVHAQERLQDWIPEALSMPEDAEVVVDRAIGSTIRMLSIATAADVDGLFADWEESLETNGYPILKSESAVMENSIQFSGPGILNAKIILAPNTEDGRSVIEFDATLN